MLVKAVRIEYVSISMCRLTYANWV